MQVEPIKPASKAAGTKQFKLRYDELLSNIGFNFNLRRYTMAATTAADTAADASAAAAADDKASSAAAAKKQAATKVGWRRLNR